MDNDKGSGISYSSTYIAEQCASKIATEFRTCQKCQENLPSSNFDNNGAWWCKKCCREEFKKHGGIERDF